MRAAAAVEASRVYPQLTGPEPACAKHCIRSSPSSAAPSHTNEQVTTRLNIRPPRLLILQGFEHEAADEQCGKGAAKDQGQRVCQE